MITTYIMAFVSSFGFIFLKAWQQLNVVHYQLAWIVPTSLAMAVAEVYVVVSAAHTGYGWIILPIGLGSGLGALSSTMLNKKLRSK